MRYIGALLIVAAGLGFGIAYARRQQRQVDCLCHVERLLEALCDRMVYFAEPLATLWRNVAEDKTLSAYPLVQETANNLCKGMDFYMSFSLAVQGVCTRGDLPPMAATLLTELSGVLGRSGLEGQERLIRGYVERLKKERQSTQQKALMCVRVYPTIGLAGGVSLALLLL